MRFVWDDDKAASNLVKHGVTFKYATRVFADELGYEWVDDRNDYGEERLNVVGLVDGFEILVTYTLREEKIRIILREEGRPL